MGRTPAFDVTVAVEISVPDSESDLQLKEVADQVIVPHDHLDIRFPNITWSGVPFRASAKVWIRYRAIDRGRGDISLDFHCEDGNWLNGPTRYRFWRRDGATY